MSKNIARIKLNKLLTYHGQIPQIQHNMNIRKRKTRISLRRNKFCSVYRSIQPGNFYSNVARFETLCPQEIREVQDLKIIFTRIP